MDIQTIIEQLREELRRIENAINALAGLGAVPARRGRPPKSASAPAGKKRTMSPAARKRISAAMKQRWAERQGKLAPKKAVAPTKKAAVRRPMSPAAKKRLSALMKARWAAAKKAGKNL